MGVDRDLQIWVTDEILSGKMMEDIVNLAFVGDIMPGGVFVRRGGVDKEVMDYMNSFDLRIGTLESAFGDGVTLCHKKRPQTWYYYLFSR